MSVSPARRHAAAALLAVSSGAATLGDALDRERRALSDSRDRALCHDLVTGTLRWQCALDAELGRVSTRALTQLDDAVRVILRMAAYQLRHLTRVPASAVVHDAVALTRTLHVANASGFVNAVLRRLADPRRHAAPPAPPGLNAAPEEAARWLSETGSHPEWLVARWVRRYGQESTEAWMRFNNTPATVCVRANKLRTTRDALASQLAAEGVKTRPCLHAPAGLVVCAGEVTATTAWQRGWCLIQDEASQLVPDVLGVQPGDRVLDLCAAPGGKTAALASDCGPAGLVVACDIRARRMRVLAATLARLGASRAICVQVPGTGALPFLGGFDRVLVDAPCSGLGTLRRDPDIRWKRVADDLVPLAARQQDLLHRASMLVRSGGQLVYATCSSEPDENEHVVQAFLQAHPSWRLVPIGTAVDVPAPVRALADSDGCLRTTPDRHGLEAFFAARLACEATRGVR